MSARVTFIYVNQPVIHYKGRYYTEMKNFIDFAAELAGLDNSYEIVIPCKRVKTSSLNTCKTPVEIPPRIIHVGYYKGDKQAVVASLLNAICVRRLVAKQLKHGTVTVIGPGPNGFLFWLSLMVPESCRFAFFIRGDTLRTVQNTYKGGFWYFVVTGLVRLFRKRIHTLLRQGRAQVFVFGEKLKEQYSDPHSFVHVISPLIDESFIAKKERPAISHERPLNILYVGRFSPEKNILALLEACSMADQSGPFFSLDIIGFGPMEKTIKEKIKALDIASRVKLLGYIPHGKTLRQAYDEHDLLCLPSKTEGIPRVVVEAFARGMPVLATPVGSLPSLFPNEIRFLNGYTAHHILEGLTWCDANREKFSAMGRAGQQKVRKFTITENAREVHKILTKWI